MISLTAQRTFEMLENQSLWQTAEQVHRALNTEAIPHAVVGGVAVCLHGYRRNTVDINFLVRREDQMRIRSTLESAGLRFAEATAEFRTETGITVQFVIAGDRAGPGQPAILPDPADANTIATIEGLPVLNLAELIQSKLACGLGNLRRTHKDFADVVELIAIHRLDKSFVKHLHKSVRREFKVLVDRVQG
jgi:hypothetical protein